MPSVKTAISVEKPIFEKMDDLAKELNVSRSRLFTIAAREFIERHRNAEAFKALNEAYDDLPEDFEDPAVSRMRSKHYQIVKDQW